MTQGLARLHLPGSLIYALRPRGWGKTSLLRDLACLLGSGKEAKKHFPSSSWIRQHKNVLFRQPKMIPILLSLSTPALQSETIVQQLRRQLIPSNFQPGAQQHHDHDNGHAHDHEQQQQQQRQIQQMHQLVRDGNINMVEAVALSSKLHGGTRIALLVDDFDAPFVYQDEDKQDQDQDQDKLNAATALTPDFIHQLCRCVEEKQGAGILLMKGTFRPRTLAAPLDRMRDLTLDLHHNNTWGMTLKKNEKDTNTNILQEEDKNKKGYMWDASEMKPVLHNPKETQDQVVVEQHQVSDQADRTLDTRCPYRMSGGYWYGGRDERMGHPEAIFSLRPWCPFQHEKEITSLMRLRSCSNDNDNDNDISTNIKRVERLENILHGIQTLVNGTYTMTEMDRWTKGTVGRRKMTTFSQQQQHDEEDHQDWALILHQAGVLTIASRSMRFDEFHSYAWIRAWFPNESARQIFSRCVLRPVILECLDEDGWNNVQSATQTLSSVLHRMDDNDAECQAKATQALQELATCARTIAALFSSSSTSTSSTSSTSSSMDPSIVLQFLFMNVSDLYVDDGIGDSVAEAELASDTFSGSRDHLIEAIRPIMEGWNLRCFPVDGRHALPLYSSLSSEGSLMHCAVKVEERTESGIVTLFNRGGYPCCQLKM